MDDCCCSYAKFGIIFPTRSSKVAYIYCELCYKEHLDPEDFYNADGWPLETRLLNLYLLDAKQYRENSVNIRDPHCSYCGDSLFIEVYDWYSVYDRRYYD